MAIASAMDEFNPGLAGWRPELIGGCPQTDLASFVVYFRIQTPAVSWTRYIGLYREMNGKQAILPSKSTMTFLYSPHRSGDIEWMNKMQVIVAVNPGPSWIVVKGGQVSPGSNVGLGAENPRQGWKTIDKQSGIKGLLSFYKLLRIAIMHGANVQHDVDSAGIY